ncbi:unannotated protein [freshwater metagenome]|uniref:Unannotated protein n=1 Tax=freshwater metagenome TaxID=449393 RepID=A0A6J7L6C3_9ZZZZ|nr:hypothetical protein [Actinomycetota bacterium]
MTSGVLRAGARGEPVRDLQMRLASAGFASKDPSGLYAEGTENSVRQFQESRRIRVDGICGPQTWASLVESGRVLGDRLLSQHRPMLRGDDVLLLQRRLNALGFDAGREDGIFGPDTSAGLLDFQRNAGVAPDGVVGPSTIESLDRLGEQAGASVAAVREREALRQATRELTGQVVFLATAPELSLLGGVIERHLVNMGVSVVADHNGTDDRTLIEEANRSEASIFISISLGDRPGSRVCYFESERYRSEAGYRMASAVSTELSSVLDDLDATSTSGRMLRVLRETKMAAVVIQPAGEHDAAETSVLVRRVEEIGLAIAAGVQRGIEKPDLDLTLENPVVKIPRES